MKHIGRLCELDYVDHANGAAIRAYPDFVDPESYRGHWLPIRWVLATLDPLELVAGFAPRFSSKAAARLGAVVFIHRFGSALNAHLHFHCCIIDGVFAAAGAADGAAGVTFHEASGLAATAVATVQAQVRQRVLRACVRRGLLDRRDGDAMGSWDHGGGFSLDASVRIEGADRAGRERLLRYCARPPFALDHWHQHDAEHLRYDIPKPRPDGPRALVLTPLELIDKVAALVPPRRVHRHRYYGVLAPNAPWRAAVIALAPPSATTPVPCARSSITWARRRGSRASPPHADRHCGRPPRQAATRPGTTPPAGPGSRIRSAHHLVSSSCWLGLGPRASSMGRGAGLAGGGDPRPAITLRCARQERNFGYAPATTRD